MATLKQAIELADGVSGPLAKISNAAATATNKMQNLGRASNIAERAMTTFSAVKADPLGMAASAAENVSQKIRGILPASTAAGSGLETLGAKASSIFATMKANVRGLLMSLGPLFAFGTLTGIMNQALAATGAQSQAELKLKTVMGQRMGANAEMVQSINDVIGAQLKMGVVSREAQTTGAQQLATFLSQSDSLATLIPAMNNLLAQQRGYNATGEDAVAVANMMGRALTGNAGALTRCGVTLTDAQENMIKYGDESQRVAAIAEAITQNVGNMNAAFGGTGKGHLIQQTAEINDALMAVGKNVAGAMNSLKAVGAGMKVDFIWLAGNAIVFVMNAAAMAGQVFSNAYQMVRPFFVDLFAFAQANWPLLAPIVIALGAAILVSWVVPMMQAAAATAIATAGAIAHAAASAIETAAIIAMTIAQEGLNVALSMCPVTWILYAIIALVAVFYLAVAAVNKFAGTSLSATGMIAAAFVWLGAMIINQFITVLNTVIRVANFILKAFTAVANFLGSVFVDPMTAIQNLFADIWNGIVQLVGESVNNIIDMVNQIPGLDKVTSPFNHVNWGQLTVAVPNKVGNVTRVKAPQIDTIDIIDAKSAAGTAYDKVSNFDLKEALGMGQKTPAAAETPVAPAAPAAVSTPAKGNGGAIKDNTAKTADNTKRIADKLDMTSEEIKELREAALQTTMQSWQDSHNIDIRIDQNNTLQNDMDIDGMTGDLINGLREAIGIHGERTAMI